MHILNIMQDTKHIWKKDGSEWDVNLKLPLTEFKAQALVKAAVGLLDSTYLLLSPLVSQSHENKLC